MTPRNLETKPHSDLSHRNLKGWDFRGLDLRYSDFHGSDLSNAKFDGAILHGANFLHTKVNSASFSGCEFFDPADQYTIHHFQKAQNDAYEAIQAEMNKRNEQKSLNGMFDEPESMLSLERAEDFYEIIFTTEVIQSYPVSNHYRDSTPHGRAQVPNWADPNFFFDAYSDAIVHDENGSLLWDTFNSKKFQTLWESWFRSVNMHNKAACFDLCEYDGNTIWPPVEHLDDYPIWNTPPKLEWSRCRRSHTWESVSWTPLLTKDCPVCGQTNKSI